MFYECKHAAGGAILLLLLLLLVLLFFQAGACRSAAVECSSSSRRAYEEELFDCCWRLQLPGSEDLLHAQIKLQQQTCSCPQQQPPGLCFYCLS